jgi:Helicase HerA, central domain/TraM recognition site of TraD and TraG
MLRFVLKPTGNGRFEFEIEGGGAKSQRLESRISAVFHSARRDGYEFRNSAEAVQHRRSISRARVKRPNTFEIVPHGKRLSCIRSAAGFGASGRQTEPEVDAMFVPDFPAAGQTRVTDYPFALLAREVAVRQLEVEYVACDLAAESMSSLGRAFDRHTAEMTGILGIAGPPATALRTFLGLWLYGRRGWEVRCRVDIEPGKQLPEGPLEVFGREIFGVECDLIESPDSAEPTNGDATDLSFRYPEGWAFPTLLPPSEHLAGLDAERIHNITLPALPTRGTVIGKVENQEVRLPIESRDRHTFVMGATGTGKSTLLQRMICDDIARGEGVVLLDPHGDLYDTILSAIPRRRRKEVFVLDPSSTSTPPGLNILELPQGHLRRRHADFLVGELLRFFEEIWDMREAGGPAFEMYFRNTLLLMCLQGDAVHGGDDDGPAIPPLHLGHFMRTMSDKKFRDRLLNRCTDHTVVEFWREVAVKTTGNYGLENFVPYITCKVNALTQAGFVAQLLCSDRDDLRIGERMDRGEIVLLNLNKGLIGGYESRLLGTILMMEIFAAGLQRSMRPMAERRPVNIYVDEFQNFVSDNVASMLSEARKFGLRLTLANQTLAQLRASAGKQNLLEAVLGNVGNMILFRLGVPDADQLRLFLEPFSRQEMQELPNFHALTRILTSAGPVRPVVMRTLK